MNVYMIGNGFDLHYCLPTTYSSFLHVVENIRQRMEDGEQLRSVAQVFKDPALQSSDSALSRCVAAYDSSYTAELRPEELAQAFGSAGKNPWFSYLLRSLDPQKGWIDFEREIREVVQTISQVLNSLYPENCTCVYVENEDSKTRHILSCFPFFYDGNPWKGYADKRMVLIYQISQKYLTEEPRGSGAVQINKALIASDLFDKLRSLAEMLSSFLRMFVDKPVETLVKSGKIRLDSQLLRQNWDAAQTVSFNYTHTMRRLYCVPERKIHYIHGELSEAAGSGIILGFDADETDELENMDVTFVQFKKYYQRVFFRTDFSYIACLESLENLAGTGADIALHVIGHSLDYTDREIIRDCFRTATRIIVYYHSSEALSDYIRNLVKIFGKREFDRLRTQKNLEFQPIEALNRVPAKS